MPVTQTDTSHALTGIERSASDVAYRLASSAERWPLRPALQVAGKRLNYGELLGRASSLAERLAENSTAHDPALTAVLAQRSPTAFCAVVAALLRGHGYVPLNPQMPVQRLRYVLQQTGCHQLVVDDAGLAVLPQVLEGVEHRLSILVSQRLAAHDLGNQWPRHRFQVVPDDTTSHTFGPVEVDGDSLAYVLFTSGSTGTPKGVRVARRNLSAFIDSALDRYGIDEADRLSQTFDLTFDLSAYDMFVAWSAGACLCVPTQAELLQPDRYIHESELTAFFAVPSLAATMDRHEMLRPGAYPGLRLCLFCGEALSVRLAEKWRQAAPNASIENVYGPTELTIFCTAYRWDPSRSLAQSENGIVAIGHPLPGMSPLVVDAYYRPVPAGQPGELLMAGPQQTLGYWKDPDKTELAFVVPPGQSDRYYRTGDRVRQVDDDGTLVFLGRIDNQIQVHGYRVELAEVEAALRGAAGVATAVAIGWPKSESGYDGIVAFLADPRCDVEAIRRNLTERLPAYMLPSQIRLLEEFPTTVSGKVDRKQLIALLSTRNEEDVYAPPTTSMEERLSQIWAEVLQIDVPGIRHSFFDLGGDSIGAAKFIHQLQVEIGETVPLTSILQHRTIEQFAAYLRRVCPTSPSRVFGEKVPEGEYDGRQEGSSRPADSRAESAMDATLVALQGNGRKLPLFMLPEASGNPFVYRSLAEQFDPDRPLLAFDSPDRLWRHDVLSTSEQIVHYYVAIRSAQPKGPYCLGGWSLGGALAFEIARRIVADGELVRSLILIDTAPPMTRWRQLRLRAIRTMGSCAMRRFGRPGHWLVHRIGFRRVRAKLMLSLREGRSSEAELRELLEAASNGTFDKRALEQLSYTGLYDELAARIELSEAEKFEYESMRLAQPRHHPLRSGLVWFKHLIDYYVRYRPTGVFPGRLSLFVADGHRAPLRWQNFCTEPIHVHRYPVKDGGRGKHNSMMLPDSVSLYVNDIIAALGED